MKRFHIIILTMFMALPIFADSAKPRIAVFDPASGALIDEGMKVAIREIISSTIVNTGDYDIVERSLLEKVMQEQRFSNSGAVDDSDATEIGKLAGANKVVLSVVTLTGGRTMLSIKMIDVKTASVERQKVRVTQSDELLDVVEPMTLALVGFTNDDISPIIPMADSNAQNDNGDKTKLLPKQDEVVFYLPSGYQPKKAKDKDLPLFVYLDKEYIGSGTLSTGFSFKISKPEGDIHKLKIGAMSIKVNLEKYNFFELQVYRWNYLGKAIYGVSIKEQKMID